jgi:uncharacterized OB-fold protein
MYSAELSPPAPVPDADSAFFWAGLKDRKVLLQRCLNCQRCRFPAMPSCPYCADRKCEIVTASGRGTVYSWIVVHRAFDPAFAAETPYTLATVDLEEGGRIVGRLEGTPAQFGMTVMTSFFEHLDWTELRFE